MAKKIMFSDKFGLTEAVLSGRKTQTRRIIKPQPEVSERMGMVWKGYAYGITSPAGSPFFLKDVYENFLSGTDYPQDHRYKVGEVVAVAQSYKDCGYAPAALDRSPKDLNVVRGTLGESKGWNNKMFVRSGGCRIYPMRIVSLRAYTKMMAKRTSMAILSKLQETSTAICCLSNGIPLPAKPTPP